VRGPHAPTFDSPPGGHMNVAVAAPIQRCWGAAVAARWRASRPRSSCSHALALTLHVVVVIAERLIVRGIICAALLLRHDVIEHATDDVAALASAARVLGRLAGDAVTAQHGRTTERGQRRREPRLALAVVLRAV